MHLSCLKKQTGVIVLCLIANLLFCQPKKVALNFNYMFGKNRLVLNDSTYFLEKNNTIKFESLKFYISNIELLENDISIYKEKKSYHLLDADSIYKIISLTLSSKLQFNKLKFNLGIDSVTNVSGALGGDLDPTKGMYWTWQSGYINFKLEGKSSLSTHLKKEFQLHLGGYAYPVNTLQTIILAIGTQNKITVLFDLQQFINKVDLPKQHHIMSPSAEAMHLSKVASTCFKVE